MNETHISFYLKAYRIHVFLESLRGIGSPRRICFMLSPDGKYLALLPYEKRDFKSHKVADEVYQGGRTFEISSYGLCAALASLHLWDLERSYRVPGRIMRGRQVVFDLTRAEPIQRPAAAPKRKATHSNRVEGATKNTDFCLCFRQKAHKNRCFLSSITN